MRKETFMRIFELFSIITTLIFFFSGIFIAIFWGTKTRLDLSYIFAVILLSFVLSSIYALIESDEKMSGRKRLIMNIVFFVIVNASVAVTGFFLEWFNFHNIKMLVGFEFTILIVYGFSMIFSWNIDKSIADRMNDRLKHFSEE